MCSPGPFRFRSVTVVTPPTHALRHGGGMAHRIITAIAASWPPLGLALALLLNAAWVGVLGYGLVKPL